MPSGWWLGWDWLDPVMGIAGAIVVAIWAKGLIRDTAVVLLDREMDHPVVDEIREVIVAQGAAGATAIGLGHQQHVRQSLTHGHPTHVPGGGHAITAAWSALPSWLKPFGSPQASSPVSSRHTFW